MKTAQRQRMLTEIAHRKLRRLITLREAVMFPKHTATPEGLV
jgi:hypothetical protein